VGGSAGNILIYNSSYVQQTSETITQGIFNPESVAIDPYGNLWVGNVTNPSSITEYTNGVQDTSNTITNGIVTPSDIAVDGLDNLWVVNDFTDVTIYSPTAVYAPPSKLVQTLNIAPQAIAVGAGAFVYGTGSQTFLESASTTLEGNPFNGGAYGFGANALAPDNAGNIYVAGTDGNLYIARPNSTSSRLATLTFTAAGMAVDNVKKRIYISDGNSKIYVYSTAGALIHTIHN
jgi:sugar lactone lactonase YvrE